MSCFLRDNSLLIFTPKSTVTLFTPDPMQANTHPKIKISDAELPLVRNPKLLGVYLDTFFSFNAHCVQVVNRVSKRNNVLKALSGTNWEKQKETLLLTYKALGISITNYAAPVWSTNTSDTSLEKIQRTQNEALRTIAGFHKMSSIDHLHSETKMLLVKDHLILLSAQYLVHCLSTRNVCHHITTMDHPPREMKETLFTRHNQTVTISDILRMFHLKFIFKQIQRRHPSPLCPICEAEPHTTHLYNCTKMNTVLQWMFCGVGLELHHCLYPGMS